MRRSKTVTENWARLKRSWHLYQAARTLERLQHYMEAVDPRIFSTTGRVTPALAVVWDWIDARIEESESDG